MNAKYMISRFSNEDVISTSDVIIVDPSLVCDKFGTLHFFTTSAGRYNATTGLTTANGLQYLYAGSGRMVFQPGVNSMSWEGEQSIPVGKFFYFDGEAYIICDPQAHAR